MEQGYATEVGEGGGRLSAGQKQLISFARAILADPQILVMDEATSSVDTETEQRIQQGLGNVLEGRIAFVIAHRLSTIRNADRIVVIEGGRITETGSHAELMAAPRSLLRAVPPAEPAGIERRARRVAATQTAGGRRRTRPRQGTRTGQSWRRSPE
jgi:ABC-type multidrug transport system fused ATPase/permease subunit